MLDVTFDSILFYSILLYKPTTLWKQATHHLQLGWHLFLQLQSEVRWPCRCTFQHPPGLQPSAARCYHYWAPSERSRETSETCVRERKSEAVGRRGGQSRRGPLSVAHLLWRQHRGGLTIVTNACGLSLISLWRALITALSTPATAEWPCCQGDCCN